VKQTLSGIKTYHRKMNSNVDVPPQYLIEKVSGKSRCRTNMVSMTFAG
jgi:hypothetical protein